MQEFEDIQRHSVKALDNILGKPFKVLDDGFIRVIDYLGNDDAIVQAARVSYGKGTKKISADRELIRYLLRHRHTSPFEMCEIKLHVRVPMDCWRQWIRHRTANVNEYSTRYSIAIDAAQTTKPDEWRFQSKGNRQGSNGFLEESVGKDLSDKEANIQNLARSLYNKRIELGVAREQARKDLPLATYTEAYWKIDLSNLFHFLELRMEKHSQKEIRQYASIIGNEIVSKWCPMAWEAFQDYHMNSLTFSRIELEVLKNIATGKPKEAAAIAEKNNWLTKKDGKLRKILERIEFEEKCQQLEIPVPWL